MKRVICCAVTYDHNPTTRGDFLGYKGLSDKLNLQPQIKQTQLSIHCHFDHLCPFSLFAKVICRDVGALVGALQQIIAVVATGVSSSVIFRVIVVISWSSV